MTNHEALRERLHGLLDGDLPASERARLGRHLAACTDCRTELAEMRALMKRAADLPAEVAPARDLWPAIAARIAAEDAMSGAGTDRQTSAAVVSISKVANGSPAPARSRRLPHAWAWTAGFALAAGLALFLLAREPGLRLGPGAAPAGPPASESLLQATLRDLESASRQAEAGYAAALQARGSALPSSAAAVIQVGLAGLDRAIDDTRSALAAAPLDPGLLRLLARDYHSRIGLLERATRLSTRL